MIIELICHVKYQLKKHTNKNVACHYGKSL